MSRLILNWGARLRRQLLLTRILRTLQTLLIPLRLLLLPALRLNLQRPALAVKISCHLLRRGLLRRLLQLQLL